MPHTASKFIPGDIQMNKTTTSQTWHLIHACKSNLISIIHWYKGGNVLLEGKVQFEYLNQKLEKLHRIDSMVYFYSKIRKKKNPALPHSEI